MERVIWIGAIVTAYGFTRLVWDFAYWLGGGLYVDKRLFWPPLGLALVGWGVLNKWELSRGRLTYQTLVGPLRRLFIASARMLGQELDTCAYSQPQVVTL